MKESKDHFDFKTVFQLHRQLRSLPLKPENHLQLKKQCHKLFKK